MSFRSDDSRHVLRYSDGQWYAGERVNLLCRTPRSSRRSYIAALIDRHDQRKLQPDAVLRYNGESIAAYSASPRLTQAHTSEHIGKRRGCKDHFDMKWYHH